MIACICLVSISAPLNDFGRHTIPSQRNFICRAIKSVNKNNCPFKSLHFHSNLLSNKVLRIERKHSILNRFHKSTAIDSLLTHFLSVIYTLDNVHRHDDCQSASEFNSKWDEMDRKWNSVNNETETRQCDQIRCALSSFRVDFCPHFSSAPEDSRS